MVELLRVAARVVGVVTPAAGVLAIVGTWDDSPDGGFAAFFAAMALTLLTAAVWSALDARRGVTARVALRWLVTTVVLSGGISLIWLEPGGPPAELTTEVLSGVKFYGVPLLVVVGLGLAAAAGMAREQRAE